MMVPPLLIELVVVVLACRLLGSVFRLIHQPQVVGDICSGILLGPSLLGWMSPQLFHLLFPLRALDQLNAVSQLGLVMFMFLVGMRINPKELRECGHAAVLTSHVSITLPFALGCLLAVYLYSRVSDAGVSFTIFALFLGTSISITAFPVLARILTERDMLQTHLGTIAIACAAVDDITGWCIVAILLVFRTGEKSVPIWLLFGGTAAFTLMMVTCVRRISGRFLTIYRHRGLLSESSLTVLLLMIFASAICTQFLGIHLLFGSFLVGAVMPKDAGFVHYIRDRFETITLVLLLPIFFALTGLRTRVDLIQGPQMWSYTLLIIVVATVAKLGGTTLGASVSGVPLREAAKLGALMNTRGLMELVVLNIGLDAKIISPTLFTMLVIMTLITTFMTSPLLAFINSFRAVSQLRDRLAESRMTAIDS